MAVHPVSTHGPGIHVENGTEALAALDVDLANIVDDALLGRIAESVDGNREYALALSELALGWAAVADARIQFGQCCDAVAEERFAEAAADYVRIAGGPPIVAANSPTMN
ncbi:hypothetical protein [Nocardia mexicana]|uniref:hypothetical protein n=1 Tax=Nocardia mexicana TaxID=279262 RepID=UPI0011C081B5|nr:hypothetical protein [Nocardia mexicana]